MCYDNLIDMVGKDEKILWKKKPNKRCYILEGIFNPMLPFAIIWGIADSFAIGSMIAQGPLKGIFLCELIMFMCFHLMPVWMYLLGVIGVFLRYKNACFLITDRAVYVSEGLFVKHYEMKPFTELTRVNISRGIFDQMLGVGDVVMTTQGYSPNAVSRYAGGGVTIYDIADYKKVYELVKQLQTDIYSDTMFPNDLRPKTNSGYKTEYIKELPNMDDNAQ